MRSFLVGIVLLSTCGSAFGQAAGYVEKIGFGKQHRPYGWTPLLVSLTSQISEPAEYQIQVRQEDLDRDRVVFRRDIVLNPRGPDNRIEQFWVYFMEQPSGLGDGSAGDLNKKLEVWLCTRSGKPLLKLNIQDPLGTVDPPRQGFGVQRGAKLVLMVIDGPGSRSTPAVREYQNAIGLNEDVLPVPVTPFDLPESVLGYDAVDAVVWLDADAGKMTSGGSRRLAAMTDYVRAGGRLVVCQPLELFKLEAMADLLPVESRNAAGDWVIQVRDRADLRPIRDLARYHAQGPDTASLRDEQQAGWDRIEKDGPFKVAFAKLRPDAVGELWIDWRGNGSEMSPWLARRPLGLGSVTWVAQDLGNPALTGRFATGWPYVWDRVLGQRNIDMRVQRETSGEARYAEAAKNLYYTSSSIDLGSALLSGMEHTGRAGGLVFLAGVFFVGYWLVAGPVSYVVLAGKKRTELSWTVFAASALAATLLTVGVVRLVLRGDPEVRHVSLVRMLPAGRADDGTPVSRAVVDSRIGLYIPRDGMQRVTLLDNDKDAVSYVTPFSVHPAHYASATEFPAYLEYEIPVRDSPLTEPVSAAFPYRSTLKKIQAHWVGHLNGGIDVVTTGGGVEQNRPRLVEPGGPTGTINGKLENRSGADLAHVYLAFHLPTVFEGGRDYDFVIYRPSWKNGEKIDLAVEFNTAARLPPRNVAPGPRNATPGGANKRTIAGDIKDDWAPFWYGGFRATGMGDQFDDARNEYLRSFPMLSLYDRVPPQQNEGGVAERSEVLRRAAREWDVSELVAAGQLVVLGQGANAGGGGRGGDSPLPFPMEVEGERVAGAGTTFYQFALPLDRSTLPNPWTKSAGDDDARDVERPDDKPAGASRG